MAEFVEAGSSVPQQLHALSMDALKAVAAAHGVVLPEKASKDEVIDLLEARKGALPAIVLKDGEKRLRALNKLLRDIEALQEKEAAGETLDEQQETKLGRLDEVLAEMEELMGGG